MLPSLCVWVSLSCLGQLPCAGKQAILNLVPVFEERNLSLSNQAFPNPHNGVGPRTTLRLRCGTFDLCAKTTLSGQPS